MSDLGMTTSQVGGAGAYARAAMLGPVIPVRIIDPTRQRFQVKPEAEQANGQPTAAQSAADQSDEQAALSSTGEDSSRGSRGGFGLLGAFTSFLVRMFAQPETEAAAPTATVQAGIQAYARSAGPMPANENGVEVMSPSFPRLSSGRAVDLTI
ncbi:MAG: hypothetical protein H7Z12_06370 [Rhodospirillaceae bacterium]|nr:hypothetical protein [Rhodospirillales bacterium]